MIGVHGNKKNDVRERERERHSHVRVTRWHLYLEHCLSTANPPTAAGPQILTKFIYVCDK